ncbi:MAG: 4-alpha-glucanotransferase [Thermoguttaceae bacterium]
MSETDPWGIQNGYWDVEGQWHETAPETRQAILAAMAAEDPNAIAQQSDRVRVLYPEDLPGWSEPGQLTLEDGTVLRIDGPLPPDLPLGYHDFRPEQSEQQVRLIVTPGQCPTPGPTWGWAVQLYAARSKESWGIGDFADLRRLARWSAGLGAGLLVLSPLGADWPIPPQQPSPYYPSSRRFLNPLYLRVEEVPGAGHLGRRLEQLAAAGRALNRQRRIDRDAVLRLKLEALEAIWAGFAGDEQFDQYRRQRQAELEPFATYCALAKSFGGDWRRWPAEFRDPTAAATKRFAADHARDLQFYQWLQWLLERQLAAAAHALPLVMDLPVGFNPAGADAWIWQDVLAKDCAIGAPPDAFNRAGQDWAMPPFVPQKLRAACYEPVVQTLRAVLRYARGLRIDHVMGLFRLYWVPEGFGPARGAYVRYRGDELMGIVALESHRAGAFVVGEDLGTVEDQTRQRMAECRMLSFRVLWFEPHPPRAYPRLAMAAVTTHDLPTIAGLWSGRDLAVQQAMGQRPAETMVRLREHLGRVVGTPLEGPVASAIQQTYARLGEAPSLVLLATLEDALAVEERPNMPGTTSQWPNWSLALPGGLEALEGGELPVRIAEALGRSRTRPAGG